MGSRGSREKECTGGKYLELVTDYPPLDDEEFQAPPGYVASGVETWACAAVDFRAKQLWRGGYHGITELWPGLLKLSSHSITHGLLFSTIQGLVKNHKETVPSEEEFIEVFVEASHGYEAEMLEQLDMGCELHRVMSEMLDMRL